MFTLKQNQAQRITFVMIDLSGAEVTGIANLTVALSKDGAAFTAGAGTSGEIGSGWYYYDLTAAETDTAGALSVRVTGTGALQQNLAYAVEDLLLGGIAFTYTVTDAITADPLAGVNIWIATDSAGTHVVWQGVTNAAGVAQDSTGNLPRLTAGTYYFFRQKTGYSFTDPDTETVS